MIKVGSVVKIADNSGAKTFFCLKNLSRKSDSIFIGDRIVGVIKLLRFSKILKNNLILYAIVIRAKGFYLDIIKNLICFKDNAVVLLDKKNNLIGSRIFGEISFILKIKGFLKLIMVGYSLV